MMLALVRLPPRASSTQTSGPAVLASGQRSGRELKVEALKLLASGLATSCSQPQVHQTTMVELTNGHKFNPDLILRPRPPGHGSKKSRA